MVVHRAMLRRIYDWCIDAAHKPYALWIMGAVSFAESSFFPVPPDVMLIPMSLARPERAWLYAAICTATSVLGGILGYAIGALLYDSIGHWLIEFYGYGDKVEAFRAGDLPFTAIVDTIEAVLAAHDVRNLASLADVEQAEAWARERARAAVHATNGSSTA